MKIKRFFGKNMTEAIEKVRETMGEDAAIISNKRVSNGIEIVAAIDYDEKILDKVNLPEVLKQQVDPRLTDPTTQAASTMPAGVAARQARVKQRYQAEAIDQQVTKQAQANEVTAFKKTQSTSANGIEDPLIHSLKEEIRTMRDMLQDDLAGLVWNDKQRETPTEAAIFKRLRGLGFDADLARDYAAKYDKDLVGEQAFRAILSTIAKDIKTTDNTLLKKGGVYAFMGPTGVGKTTSIAKLAAQYTLRHGSGKVALLTTDSYRIGAYEQLKVFSKLLDAPLREVSDENGLRAALRSFENKELILIDTAGMSQRDIKMQSQLKVFTSKRVDVKSYLVLSATCQRLVLASALSTFHKANIDAVLITKVDEGISLGGILSLIISNQLPISYLCNGQHIPEDCHVAHSHNLISCAVTMVQQFEQTQSEKSLATAFGGRDIDVDV